MHLPFFKKNASEPKREYLFALEIGYESVKSAIWTVANDKTQVLAIGTTVKCQTDIVDSLIPGCDQTLSDVAVRLDQGGRIQPEKMILGLPNGWSNGDKIDPEKLRVLRDLTKKLSLSPLGFVVTTQALVKHLHLTEGVPPTAIIIGFWQNTIEVTLARLGKIEATQIVKRSGQVTLDVVEGLSRFGKLDMLPSRILIYDSGSNLEGIKQELLGFAWQAPQTRLPFLHFPKVEILPPDFSIKAVSLAGGSEVATALGLIANNPENPGVQSDPLMSEDLGFVAGVDIAVLPEVSLPAQKTTPVEDMEAHEPKAKPKITLPSLKFPSVHLHIHKPSAPLSLFFGLIGLLGFGAALFAAYWYLPKATVVITVIPKPIEQTIELTASTTTTAPDLTLRVIPAVSLAIPVTGHLAKSTTGSKLVGDKAIGEVTVINGTAAERSFPAGTVLTAPDGLKFTFDTSINIASASGSADPNSYVPGKAKVKITAQNIGNEGNFSAGTQFKLGTFSTLDYVAKNDAAFTGGSSRQALAVSAQDLTDLRSQLTASLTEEARTKLSGSVPAGSQLVAESVKISPVSEKFDAKVGDTVDTLGLDLSLNAVGLSFVSSDLDNLITGQLATLIPTGYEQEGEINRSLAVKNVKEKQLTLTVQVTATLTPQLANSDIIKNITGKSVTAAKSYLESLSGISRIDFKFIPSLPSPLLTLPHLPKNIGIVIKS